MQCTPCGEGLAFIMYILPVVRNLISTNVTAAYGAKPQNSSLGELLLIDSLRKKSIMSIRAAAVASPACRKRVPCVRAKQPEKIVHHNPSRQNSTYYNHRSPSSATYLSVALDQVHKPFATLLEVAENRARIEVKTSALLRETTPCQYRIHGARRRSNRRHEILD
jgi:hypothetical protein